MRGRMTKILLLAAALAGPAWAKDWVPVTTPDGAFKFAAPTPPGIETQTGTAKTYAYRLTTYSAMDGEFAVVALAEHFDSPTIAINPETVAARLLAKMKLTATINTPRPYQRGPHDIVPGVFLAGASAAENCQIRAAVDGSDAFVLMACSMGATSYAAEKDTAMASFTLLRTHSAAAWVPVTSGFGALHFRAPAAPEISKKNNAGVPQTILYARDGGLLVLATYADAGDSAPVSLDTLADGYIDGGKYKLIAKTPMPYAFGSRTLPGYLLDVENPAMHCKTRLVADGTKTYALGACVTAGYDIGDLPDQVLASFAME